MKLGEILKFLSLSLKNQVENCCASKKVIINKINIKTMKTTPSCISTISITY